MSKTIVKDLEKLLATMCRVCSDEGKPREVAILAHGKASVRHESHDNWNGGLDGYTILLELPDYLHDQLKSEIEDLEKRFLDKSNELTRGYEGEFVERVMILAELTAEEGWRDKAKAFVSGQGLSNQGRVRSDNVAPLSVDGLLFRSQPEIWLYKAFKARGVSFAPLPVFIRGGDAYRRIEPDFVVLKDGVLMIVEVDGDTVHRETPLEAHTRTTMLAHEGAHIERVNASDCDNESKPRTCAERLLGILEKLRKSR